MFQIRVEAYDNGTPSKTDVTIVKVTVDRNLNAPVFLESSVTVDIPYTQELGVTIALVSALDDDTQVSGERIEIQ